MLGRRTRGQHELLFAGSLRELIPDVSDADHPTMTRAGGFEQLRALMTEWQADHGGAM